MKAIIGPNFPRKQTAMTEIQDLQPVTLLRWVVLCSIKKMHLSRSYQQHA